MGESIDQRRIFLLTIADKARRDELTELIRRHVAGAVIFLAGDGMEALMKIGSAPPHVLITDGDLPKLSGRKLIESVLNRRMPDKIAMILLSEIPDEQIFVEEVTLSQVQFLGDYKDDVSLSRCLARSLNYLAFNDAGPDFSLRFLAPGDVLIRIDEKVEFVYIVRRGTLRAYLDQDETEVVLGQIDPGDFVGEMAYINGEGRVANVMANSDCELIEIPIDHLDHLLFQKPSWSKALMKTLSKRLKNVNARL